MVRVRLRVECRYTTFTVSVEALNIAKAVEATKQRYDTAMVSVCFPLDMDFFIADTSKKGSLSEANGKESHDTKSKDQPAGSEDLRVGAPRGPGGGGGLDRGTDDEGKDESLSPKPEPPKAAAG
jgi:hypothetical protein